MPAARSPNLAAVLSFLFPGVGQMYAGATRRGLLLALPVVGLIVVLLLVLAGGSRRLLDLFLSSQALIAVLVLILVFLCYHALTVLDAYRIAQRGRRRASRPQRGSSALVAVLLAVLVALYGVPEYLGFRALVVGGQVIRPPDTGIPSVSFAPEPSAPVTPTPAATPTAEGTPATPGPGTTTTPAVTLPPVTGDCPAVNAAWASDGRLNLLLLGADEGPGRTSLRTDTIILLSVDMATCRAALFGFPRNMTMVPLSAESAAAYPGGRFPEFLFALWVRAMEQPQNFPGDDASRGWRAVAGAVQELSGVPIDGMVGVNLNGFVGLVDALGGLWVNVPRRLQDDDYPREDGSGRIVLDIRRGCQLLEGWRALAYARSRHQDDDYQRMRRQQLVLTAFRRQFDPLALLPRVNDLLNIAESNLWLFVNRDDIGAMARLASGVDPDRVRTITFAPPRYTSPLDDATIGRIRTVVRTVFDRPAPVPTPTPSGSPAPRCPP